MNKRTKFVLAALIAICVFVAGYWYLSKQPVSDAPASNQPAVTENIPGGSNSPSGTNDTSPPTSAPADSSHNGTGAASGPGTIAGWSFSVPEGFKPDDKYSGPWYEKRYLNDKGASVLFGYYEPNGIDNRSNAEIFTQTVSGYEQQFMKSYGQGTIQKQEIDNENMTATVFYLTNQQKIMLRSQMKDRVWKTVTVVFPRAQNSDLYKGILENIK